MIRHLVMWNVKGATVEERLEVGKRIKHAFEGLRGLIPGMSHVEVGLNFNNAENACDAVLFTEFESPAALREYADHPEHLRVRDQLIGLRLTRHYVDYEIK